MKCALRILLVISMISTSCNFGRDFGESATDKAVRLLNRAIDELDILSADWERILGKLVRDLGSEARDVAREVNMLLMDSVAYVGVEFRCNVDFIGTRVKEYLTYMRDKLLHHPTSPPEPWVCHFNPGTLTLIWNPQLNRWDPQQPIVNITGFNFAYSGLPKVDILNASNVVVGPSNVTPAFQSAYVLQLNFQTEEFTNFQSGYRFALRWQGPRDPNMISVQTVLPPEPTPTPVPPPPIIGASPVKEADLWGACGDMSADYDLPIAIPAGFQWDGDIDRVSQLTVVNSGRGADNMSWNVVGTPWIDGPSLWVRIHVGARCWLGGPKIFIQAKARFVSN
jgi:hypothetical protein